MSPSFSSIRAAQALFIDSAAVDRIEIAQAHLVTLHLQFGVMAA